MDMVALENPNQKEHKPTEGFQQLILEIIKNKEIYLAGG
jgi:hypothetical protein